MLNGFFDAQSNGPGREQPLLDPDGLLERVIPCATAASIRPTAHSNPPTRRAPDGPGRASSRRRPLAVMMIKPVSSNPRRPARPNICKISSERRQLFTVVALVDSGGQRDTAQGEIDSRRQPHRGDDHTQLARLGQRFDTPARAA